MEERERERCVVSMCIFQGVTVSKDMNEEKQNKSVVERKSQKGEKGRKRERERDRERLYVCNLLQK